ncbi:MAG: zinc ABC transporter substrate-binding protein [Andreesenia angusta]|nr:zinc ABC transporter substrate-binding protein [Andreesenia angusta]
MKRFLALAMSISLIAISAVGCSGGDDGNKDNGSTDTKVEDSGDKEGKSDEKDESKEDSKEGGKKTVVATTTMLKDLVDQLSGDHLEVDGLMGPGVDPHLYKPSAGDVNKLEEADLVVYGGLHLEGQMGEVFGSLEKKDKMILDSSSNLDESLLLKSPDFQGNFDPHIWFDVTIWQEVAKEVEAKLEELDPENKDDYKSNLDSYLAELDELDKYVEEKAKEVPEDQRVLVTAHDAFNYFAKRYGFEVKGLQGISTESEASTSDVTEISDFIKDRKIKAIFVESSVPKKNVEALQEAVKAKGFDVQIGGELYSDSLGDEGSGDDTYIATVKHNIDTIAGALK